MNVASDLKFGHFYFFGPPLTSATSEAQFLVWILMWKKGKNLVYLHVKLSILSIGGPRLILINITKCPTKSLIKKWDAELSSRFAWRYSLFQYKKTLVYLGMNMFDLQSHGGC